MSLKNYNYDISTLKLKQAKLAELSKEKTGLTDLPVDDLVMWLLAEAGEALNEAKFFKYCRKIEVNRDKLLEELTDCLFMFLEISLIEDFTNTDYANANKVDNLNMIDTEINIAEAFSYLMSDISLAYRKYQIGYTNDFKRKLYDAMCTYVSILYYYKFTNEELHTVYNKKYEVNVARLMAL